MNQIKPYAKAIAAGIVAGLTTLATALSDGTVTPVESITVALAFIAGTGIIYQVRNTPPAG